MTQQRLYEIDALRGIAALIVAFVFHVHHMLGYYRTGPLDGLPVFSWLHDYGYTLVDLFFVVSGFVFSHVYLANGRMTCSGADFALARFARLYPLHLVTLIAAAGVLAAGVPATANDGNNDAYHFVLNLFMLQESGLNTGLSFNSPAWSISVEVVCYLLFYLIASRFPEALMKAAFVLVAFGFLATATENQHVDHIARGICGFFAGVLAFRLRALPALFWLALLVFGIFWLRFGNGPSMGAMLSLTCWPALTNLAQRAAVLRARPFVWLGDRSYSVYLVHSPVYMAVNVFLFAGQPVPQDWTIPVMLAGWGAVLVLSDISYRYLEGPAREWLRDQRRPVAG
jgi:peptidoglycan/LPS O-acetylase OafA/YrhL